MKPLLLLLVFAVGAFADEPIHTRYFRIFDTSFCGNKAEGGADAEIKDGLDGDALTKATDARAYLEARGVSFPQGSKAHYHRGASLLVVTNTADNLKRVAEIIRLNRFESKSIRVEVHVMEVPPEADGKLREATTLTALQQKFGPQLKCICLTGITTRSGNRAVSGLEHAEKFSKRTESDDDTWPPPRGAERTTFEVEPIAPDNSENVDMQFSFRHAAPAGAGQPPVLVEVMSNATIPDGHVLNVKSFTVRDPKAGLRHYAVLVGCYVLDSKGRTLADARAENDRLLKR